MKLTKLNRSVDLKRKSLEKQSSTVRDVDDLPPGLRNYFGYCLYKSAMRMRERLDTGLDALGIIAPQLGIMSVLEERGSQSQIDIANCMTIDRATMVKLIDGLEKRGFVARKTDASDRRVNLVVLTTAGEKSLRQARIIARKTEAEFLSKLSSKEATELKATIAKLMS